jgi:hypothetical protein
MTHNKVLAALSVADIVTEFDAAQQEISDLRQRMIGPARELARRAAFRAGGLTPTQRLAELLGWHDWEAQTLLDDCDPPH